MAARVIIDTIQDSALQWGPDGISLIRSMTVDDLSGDPSGFLFQAINTSGVPTPNSVHPNATLSSYGVMVVGYDVRPTNPPSDKAVVVLVQYKSPWRAFGTNLLLSFEGGLVQEITDVDLSSGVVVSIDVTNAGTGYSSPPTVNFSGGGGGSGAAATASIELVTGTVTGISVTNSGTGYTSVPSISLTGGGGSGATATANLGGKPIQVLYFPSVEAGDTIPSPTVPESMKCGGQVPVMRPYEKIIAQQNIVAATLNGFNSATYIESFLGYTNAAPWRGKPAQTWLCLQAVAPTQNGRNYILTREFMWKPTSWLQNVAYVLPSGSRPYNAFIDPSETGLDPANPSTYAGKKTNGFSRVKVYGTADYTALGF